MKRDTKQLTTYKFACSKCKGECRVAGYDEYDALKRFFALNSLCVKCKAKDAAPAAESEDKTNE